MRLASILTAAFCLLSCGPNKELLLEKFEGPLRDQMASMSDTTETSVELLVVGICDTTINARMRGDLIDAGADVLVMKGVEFTAKIPDTRMFDVADLEFVRKLRLQKTR